MQANLECVYSINDYFRYALYLMKLEMKCLHSAAKCNESMRYVRKLSDELS